MDPVPVRYMSKKKKKKIPGSRRLTRLEPVECLLLLLFLLPLLLLSLWWWWLLPLSLVMHR
jgi:hypothetical protein